MPTTRDPAFSPYRQAQLDARASALALSNTALRQLDAALKVYAAELSLALSRLGRTPRDQEIRAAIQRSRDILTRTILPQITNVIGVGRGASFEEILNIQRQATLAVAASHNVPGNLLGAVTLPNISMAGAWEALGTGSATWKTLLHGYVGAASADVEQIMATALTNGMSPNELARRLRPVVQGAEPFRTAFKGASTGITDQMLADPRFTNAAYRLRYNADRIAFSEIHNARGEAEVQAYAADPFVRSVRWTLSPNRGTQKDPDVCDALAKTNWYGLGRGVYPVSKVPVSPHPFDRCERVPVTRPIEQMRHPKPNPPQQIFIPAGLGGLSRAEAATIRQQAADVMTTTEITPSVARLSTLAVQSEMSANSALPTFAADALEGRRAEMALAGQRDALTKAEIATLNDYVQKGGYIDINPMLRTGKLPFETKETLASLKAKIAELTAVIGKLTVPADVVVWRGGAGDLASMTEKQLQKMIGKIVTDKAFTSTSLSSTKAAGFGRWSPNILKIIVPEGTNAAYLSGLGKGSFAREQELLLQRGARLRVTGLSTITTEYGVKRVIEVTVEQIKVSTATMPKLLPLPPVSPEFMKKKHDIIAYYRRQFPGFRGPQDVLDAIEQRTGRMFTMSDYNWNVKWYGTEKLPYHPALKGAFIPPTGGPIFHPGDTATGTLTNVGGKIKGIKDQGIFPRPITINIGPGLQVTGASVSEVVPQLLDKVLAKEGWSIGKALVDLEPMTKQIVDALDDQRLRHMLSNVEYTTMRRRVGNLVRAYASAWQAARLKAIAPEFARWQPSWGNIWFEPGAKDVQMARGYENKTQADTWTRRPFFPGTTERIPRFVAFDNIEEAGKYMSRFFNESTPGNLVNVAQSILKGSATRLQTLEAMNQAASALTDLWQRGAIMPEWVDFRKIQGTAWGQASRSGIVIDAMKVSQSWRERYSAFQYKDWVHPDPRAVVFHEAGHTAHWAVIKNEEWRDFMRNYKGEVAWTRVYEEVLPAGEKIRVDAMLEIARKVSGQATWDPLEFIAETYAGLTLGVKFEADVLDLYRRLGGPMVPGVSSPGLNWEFPTPVINQVWQ